MPAVSRHSSGPHARSTSSATTGHGASRFRAAAGCGRAAAGSAGAGVGRSPEGSRTSTTVVDGHGGLIGRGTSQVAWTPDGSRLLFESRAHALETTGAGTLGGSRRLLARYSGDAPLFVGPERIVVEVMGGGELEIPLAGGPSKERSSPLFLGARSRTGRWVYRGYDPQGSGPQTIPVYVTDTSGEHPRLLARFPWDDADGDGIDVAWAGDRVLVTTHVVCRGDDLYVAPATGDPARRLTRGPGDFELPAGSPDGTRIAYSAGIACGHGEAIHLETIRGDGTQRTRVTDEGYADGSFDEHAAWSPNGAQLVFIHGTFDTETLDAVDSAGGVPTTLAKLGTSTLSAQPTDGVHYGYVQQAGVLAIPLTGGAPERVAATPTRSDAANCRNGGTVAWSPDGSEIAIGWTGGIWTLRLGANAKWHLVIRVPCAGDPAFSPDGRQIAFDAPHPSRRAYQTDIFVADADGSHAHTVSAAPFRQSVHPTWLKG